MYDNELVNTTVVIEAGVSGAEVFHNIAPADFLTDNGTGTITAVNGWGNVAEFAGHSEPSPAQCRPRFGARRAHTRQRRQRLHPAG
jgi:hypothetical protein